MSQKIINGELHEVIVSRPIGQYSTVCSFSGVGTSLVTTDMTARSQGTGVGVSQQSGSLLITTGTTANSEFLGRSITSFNGSLFLRYKTILSQRIINNNFMVLLADMIGEGLACTINSATSISVNLPAHGLTSENIGQSMMVGAISGANGVPGRYAIASINNADTVSFTVAGWPASGSCTVDLFGWNFIKNLYNGAVATTSQFDTQRNGWANGDTALTTSTTALPGHMAQVVSDGRNVYFGDELVASQATPNITTRGSKVENVPDDTVPLYVYLWSYNGTVSTASNTTWTVGFWAVESFANQPVFIAGSKHQGTQAPLPVAPTGVQTISGTISPVTVATPYILNSLGSTNGALILTGTGGLHAFYASNIGATAAFVKLYNKAATPTVGTDVPAMIIPIPPAVGGIPGIATLPIGFAGFRFALGMGIAITGAADDTDLTAVSAGQVKVMLSRTV